MILTSLRNALQDCILTQAFRVLDMLCLSFFSYNSRTLNSLHVQCSYQVYHNSNFVVSNDTALDFVEDTYNPNNNVLPYAFDIAGDPLQLSEYRYIDLVLAKLNSAFPVDVLEFEVKNSGSWRITTSSGISIRIKPEDIQSTEQWRVVQTNEQNSCVHFVCYGPSRIVIE